MRKSLNKIGSLLAIIGGFWIVFDRLPSRTTIAAAIATGVVKLPPPPPNRGITGHRTGTASRSSDRDPTIDTPRGGNKKSKLTAFAPEYRNPPSTGTSNPESTKVWGLTTKEHPNLWFYLPYSQSSIDRIDFILKERNNLVDRTVYQTVITPPNQPGIINLPLPNSIPLAIGKLYQWELKVTMKSESDLQTTTPNQPKQMDVTGWIQRSGLTKDLSDKIKQTNLDLSATTGKLQQANLYAENGYWYDALSTLAELRRDFPQDPDIQQDWKNILNSVDLAELADRPCLN